MASPRREIPIPDEQEEEEQQVREARRKEIPDEQEGEEQVRERAEWVFFPKLETEFCPEVTALVEKGLSRRRAIILDMMILGGERYDPGMVAEWLALDRWDQEQRIKNKTAAYQ